MVFILTKYLFDNYIIISDFGLLTYYKLGVSLFQNTSLARVGLYVYTAQALASRLVSTSIPNAAEKSPQSDVGQSAVILVLI